MERLKSLDDLKNLRSGVIKEIFNPGKNRNLIKVMQLVGKYNEDEVCQIIKS
jgi:predicted CopG family antitoxin